MNEPTPASAPTPAPVTSPKPGMSTGVKVLLGCGLMVPLLVCCIGVLSATAIPAFLEFTRRSKTAEAVMQVGQLAERVSARCQAGNPAVGAGPVPLNPTPDKQLGDFSADPGFAALGFAPAEPLYFSYAVIAAADGSTIIVAEGDLDGDSVRSRFQVECSAACACGELAIERELE